MSDTSKVLAQLPVNEPVEQYTLDYVVIFWRIFRELNLDEKVDIKLSEVKDRFYYLLQNRPADDNFVSLGSNKELNDKDVFAIFSYAKQKYRKVSYEDLKADIVQIIGEYVTQSYNAGTTQNIVLSDDSVAGIFVEYVCKSASYAQEGILRVVQFDDVVKYHESFESLQENDMDIELSVYIAGGEIRLQLINNTGENIIFTYKKELKR